MQALRFLVDESVSGDIIQYLRSSDHDVVAIVEEARGANDEFVLMRAVDEDRILITVDKDFGELVFHSGQSHVGVLLLRLKDETAQNQVRVLASVLNQYADKLPGQFAVVQDERIRFRGGRTFLLKEEQEQE
jgi:predicted nuclease of predicted toxin-antitoxin system